MNPNQNNLITRNTSEIIGELNSPRRAYVGFEPSGKPHLGLLILARKIRDFKEAGLHTTILLADWHAAINDKFNGNLSEIQNCGKEMEQLFNKINAKPDTYLYASEYVNDSDYWATVLRVAKASTLQRIKRATTIMGRTEEESDLDFSKLIYPAMQVADIFYNKWDVVLGGLDQRHAHMLARDVATTYKLNSPVAIHTPILPSLSDTGRMDSKMSKSKPNSAIFLDDTPQEIITKINTVFCEQGNPNTPLLPIIEHIVLPELGNLRVLRPARFGGDIQYQIKQEIINAIISKQLHPKDLKSAVAGSLIEILK